MPQFRQSCLPPQRIGNSTTYPKYPCTFRLSSTVISRQFSAWPKRFADLQQIGLGSALSDWLELVFDAPEEALVASFCYLMSREETHLVLQKSEAFHAALFSRLAAGLAGESPAVQAAVKLPLLETMRVALTGMTDCAWPDQVFSLEAATENAGG